MVYYFSANYMRVNLLNKQAVKDNRFALTVSSKDGNNENAVSHLHFRKVSCHYLPPQGHIRYPRNPLSYCVSCHAGLVDIKGNIIGKTKDINGKVIARGN